MSNAARRTASGIALRVVIKEKRVKILVPVKRVVDYNVKVRVKPDGSGVDLANVKMSMNPFDEIAVEEAVRLKEAGVATEVVVVSAGVPTVRRPCARRWRWAPIAASWCRPTSNCSRWRSPSCCRRCAPRNSPDSSSAASRRSTTTPTRPARCSRRLLGWPQATFASKLVVAAQHATVTREIDGGLETVEVDLPAVVTTDLRLNEPRYATLPNIMKAKKKPLETTNPAALGVDVAPRLKTLQGAEPPKRSAGIKVADAADLVLKLKTEAKVI
jgi:electron transfer flavoprotein beta subunit